MRGLILASAAASLLACAAGQGGGDTWLGLTPGSAPGSVTLIYFDDSGAVTRTAGSLNLQPGETVQARSAPGGGGGGGAGPAARGHAVPATEVQLLGAERERPQPVPAMERSQAVPARQMPRSPG
jgi:hypothetical protein